MSDEDLYQFPAARFVKNPLWRQWWCLMSEVIAVGKALLSGSLQHAARKTWRVKQGSETMHRVLAGRGADVEMAKEHVLSGCDE